MKNNLIRSRSSYGKIFGVSIIALFMAMTAISAVVLFATPVEADGTDPSIWTTDIDGNIVTDFAPGDIVYIHGEGFLTEYNVDIDVTRPNATVESGSTMSEADGTFVYEYDLDGITGNYTIDATDGEKSAQTTFTDAIFTVESYSDSGYSIQEDDFLQGETVYGKGTVSKARTIRLRFKNPSGTVVKECPSDYGKVTTCSYALPPDAPTGEWEIQIQKFNKKKSSWITKKTDHFIVRPPLDTVYVDDDYTSSSYGGHIWGYNAFDNIQGGVDAVDVSGTVYVADGTYNEHVIINKQLTFLGANAGVNPVTEERGSESIIDGTELTGAGGLVFITGAADGIVFDGFTVRESFYSAGGIDIAPGSDNGVYENNIVSDNENTAFFILGDGNVIRNNVISNNRHSGEIGQINLQMDADGNIIENNTISGGGWIQIMLWNAFDGNIVQYNTITGIDLDIAKKPTIGILLSDVGNDNIVRGNTINPEEGGTGFDRAINLAGARFGGSNTLVEDNIIHHNGIGIYSGSEIIATSIKGNDVQWNEKGIRIMKSIGTIVEDNDILNNDVGVIIESSSPEAIDTRITQNNIVDNTIGVLNEISTTVDATNNWWGDNSGPHDDTGDAECSYMLWNCDCCDLNEDGLGDSVSDNVDYCPWILVDGTPPDVYVELGGPQIPGTIPMIGPSTPVWIKAEDDIGGGGTGAYQIQYSTTGPSPGNFITVIDNEDDDEDDREGYISVRLYFNDDCHHEIDYRAQDYYGNWNPSTGHLAEYFYVDATPPTTVVEVEGAEIDIPGTPYSWMGSCTIKWINVTDGGCEGGAGAESLHLNVYLSERDEEGPWVQIESYIVPDGGSDGKYADLDTDYGEISVKFQFVEDCWHTVEHWAVDYVENEEPYGIQLHMIDVHYPVSYLEIIGGQCQKDDFEICVKTNTFLGIITENVGVPPCIYPDYWTFLRIYVEDEDKWYPDENGLGNYDGYGVAAERQFWKDKWWYVYTDPFTFQEECNHILEFFAKDPLCNTESTHVYTFHVDDQAPVIIKTIYYPNYVECDDCANDLTNPGFETGDLTDWNVVVTDSVTVVTADGFTSPYTGTYMARLGDDNSGGTQPIGPNQISQVFTVTQGTFAFAYNLFTYDYIGFNNFEYKLETTDGTIIAYYSQGAWGSGTALKTTGWRVVAIDVSNFMGQDLKFTISCGGTIDDALSTWAYVDCAPDTGIFVRPDTIIEIDAADMGCCDELSYVGYKINDEAEWHQITVPYDLSFGEECVHKLDIRALDCLGHETIHTETFYVDGTPPDTFLIKVITGDQYDDGIIWVTTDTEFTFDTTPDPDLGCIGGVGLDYIKYRIMKWDDSSWQEELGWTTYGGMFKMPSTCRHKIEWYGVDLLGNEESHNEQEHYVDDTPPKTLKTVGTPSYSGDYWVTTSTDITLDATDYIDPCDVGVDYIYYEIWHDTNNDGTVDTKITDEVIYADSVTFRFTEECLHEIRWYAVDLLGNIETEQTQQHRVDDTPPVTMKTFTGDTYDSNYWVTTSTEIILTATDQTDPCAVGVNYIHYEIWWDSNDDGTVDTEKVNADIYDTVMTFSFTEECLHEIRWYAVDKLGNGEPVINIQQHRVDSQPPRIDKIVGYPKFENPDDPGTWWVTTYTEIKLSAYDELYPCAVGVKELKYKIEFPAGVWTDWIDYTGKFTFNEGSVHNLSVIAIDYLGNYAYDNETFIVHGSGSNDPQIEITYPEYGSTQNARILEVVISASDLETLWPNLDIKLWIAGGRRDAPDLIYDVIEGDEPNEYVSDVPIYCYQNGTQITLWALAIDGEGNIEFAVPVTFYVDTTILWDQWMQKGWNRLTLPFGSIACDDSVESVLASINNGNFDFAFHYDGSSWSSWVYGEPANTLNHMSTGKEYWIHIAGEGMRFYISAIHIDLEKYVWDECWEDSTEAVINDIVRFNISIHNDGTCCLFTGLYVVDDLPAGLAYVSGSTVVTFRWDAENIYEQESGPEVQPNEQTNPDGSTTLTWGEQTGEPNVEFALPYCAYIYIEFNAKVVECGHHTNEVYAEAYYTCCDYDRGDGSAEVRCE